ncbi:MAG: thiol:disulfide oxidoreductase [Phormidesmis sp. RL_2_1]|nr:thiol:disulfide oxidoreductase [Phormidesmis sp. RL_2_1]
MIDLYFWATPNGYKPLIFLEEAALAYELKPVNIMKGEQFDPDFLAIAPNNRIPAITDHAPKDDQAPLSIFESGAILLYLAEKTDAFLPTSLAGRYDAVQWLMWQMGGLGPMAGQANHFVTYAPEDVPYGKKRYVNETKRLMGVLDKRLADRPFVATTYSIADMAIYPWAKGVDSVGIDWQHDFPHVAEWAARIAERSAVKQAYDIGDRIKNHQPLDDEARQNLFGSDKK